MQEVPIVIGLGEALFDLLPGGAKLGGAPLNVAVHAHQLGNRGVVVSRIGRDDYGGQVSAALEQRGMPTNGLQIDAARPTGTVHVQLSESGEPTYTIVEDVAWDAMAWDEPTQRHAESCAAVCFGTLAQRSEASRDAVRQFVRTADQAIRLFDVNLRQHYYNKEILAASFSIASAAKLNVHELQVLAEVFDLDAEPEQAAVQLLRRHGLAWVAVTRGSRGTMVLDEAGVHESQPVAAKPGGDSVGAGDSTSAALLHGAMRRWPWERTLKLANTLGAYVASQSGACPPLPDSIRAMARG